MRLKLDDHNGVYVWVDDNDEEIELSPHFDYEADAIQWQMWDDVKRFYLFKNF